MKKRNQRMGKRGVFYVYISSLMLLVVVIIFTMYNQYKFVDKQKTTQTRIMAMNDFIRDMEFDSKRVIYVSGFRSLIAIEDYASITGAYLNDTEELFRIAFFNGTVNGTRVSVLNDSSYSDYLMKLKRIAARVGLYVDVNVTGITLAHDSPWSINVTIFADVKINDTKGLASWDFEEEYSTSVPLENIRDPVYSVSTYGKVPNAIRRTNVTDFVEDITNSTLGLQTHNNNTYYYENTKAPSFLMRLSGNFTPSPYGIESLVFLPELDNQGVAYDSSRSVVDYILFTTISGYSSNVCAVEGMESWFKMDVNHTNTYEVNQLNYTVC